MSFDPTAAVDAAKLQATARKHLWPSFTNQQVLDDGIPVITRAEGHYLYEASGRRIIDGLSGLFVVNAGHGRERIIEAAAAQLRQLDFMPLWSYAHPAAIELSERLSSYAPGRMNKVFFTSGGGEAVESAFKLAKQFWKIQGRPMKHKVLSRATSYHGTSHGALAITGIPGLKAMYEPLVPGAHRVPNTNFYRAAEMGAPADDLEAFGQWAANRIEEAILFEGPETVAAVFLEPVQNSGGCFTAPPSYFASVREICDRYDVLLVSDEVICAYGRIGDFFAAKALGYEPDIITSAKGITSGYVPLGAMLVSDRVSEPFATVENTFYHGFTFAGHPAAASAALANLDIFEEEDLNGRVRENSPLFRAELEKLLDLDIVGDVRGDGYFFAIELVKNKATRETFTDEESDRLLRVILNPALYEAGLHCRGDDRGNPVIQLAPPLTMGPADFAEMGGILRSAIKETMAKL
ncbi:MULTISPECIES: aspartate aminotransferase family protein [unclassified Pseudarthrobacter]|uniref:aspartate aminotransferase family protein n=1 Tax=unclassified Pseudarthrobacter TaxID=2647000 RepID=UPI0030788750